MEILKVKNLCKNYGKGNTLVKALDNISFSVEKGEFVAIVGASGSGKSTLLHLLGGVDHPTSGEIIIDGENIYKLNENNLAIFRRRQVGLIYQFYNLIPILNVEENITKDLKYEVAEKADMKEMKITNQGGIMVFRCSNCDIANYVANDEQINHNELLKKANISLEELKINIKFDISIKLDSGKIYKASIPLELPLEDVIENGTASKEFTDMSKYVFKRIKE